MNSYRIVMKITKDNVDQSTEKTALPNPRRNEEDKTITGVTIKNKKVSFCQFLLVGRSPAFFLDKGFFSEENVAIEFKASNK